MSGSRNSNRKRKRSSIRLVKPVSGSPTQETTQHVHCFKQGDQLSQRDRSAGWVSCGQ